MAKTLRAVEKSAHELHTSERQINKPAAGDVRVERSFHRNPDKTVDRSKPCFNLYQYREFDEDEGREGGIWELVKEFPDLQSALGEAKKL